VEIGCLDSCEIITFVGADAGVFFFSSFGFSVNVAEPDLRDNIAATAASSSGTNGSSSFSSERTLAILFDGGGVRVGVTTAAFFSEGDPGGVGDAFDIPLWASSSDFCDSKETTL